MASWAQRLLTVLGGAGLVVAGVLVGQPLLIVAGTGVIGWSIPHVADRNGNGAQNNRASTSDGASSSSAKKK